MVFGAVQAVEERVLADIAAEASGLELDASSAAVRRTDRIVRDLIRPGLIYRDTTAPEIHTIVGNMDDARALGCAKHVLTRHTTFSRRLP